jgi:MFS family permease
MCSHDATVESLNPGAVQPGPASNASVPRDEAGAAAAAGGWLARLGWNVVCLGLTSLLTDVSSEMVSAILPLYLTYVLRFSPVAFGLFDGLYQGVSALVRIWGGLIADRRRRHKEVAAAGYATSALCKLGLLASGSLWIPTTTCLLLDRLGKGVRTAPRDALIALSSPRAHVAEAFGAHRAMDTAGALLGPLVAFALLARAPAAFDAIFVVSFACAVAGLGVLLLLVENRATETRAAVGDHASWRSVVALLRVPAFRTLLIVACALSLSTVSDAFVFLVVQRRANLAPHLFPLLPVAVALTYLLLAIPAGRLADGFGRARVLLAGYGALAAAYVLLAWPEASGTALLSSLLLFGAYYAATDGVLMAMASGTLPPERLTSGLALLTTGTVLARLLGSVAFGAIWSWRGPEGAVLLFLCGLGAAVAVAARALRERR